MTLTYEPLTTVPAKEQHRPDLATSRRINCPRCDKTFVATKAICISGPWPFEQFNTEGWFHLYCDHCNVIHSFWAMCDEQCRLTSEQQLTSPCNELSGRRFIAKFLRRYPHAAGVEQT